MKHRVFLNLTEQLIMIFFFALTAAICLNAFVTSYTGANDAHDRDQAVLAAESAADTLKACSGDTDKAAALLGGTGSTVNYSANWQVVSDGTGSYSLTFSEKDSGIPYLGSADISVVSSNGQELYSLSVSWQEVAE